MEIPDIPASSHMNTILSSCFSDLPCEITTRCKGCLTTKRKRVKSRPVANGINGFTGGKATGYHTTAGVNNNRLSSTKAPVRPWAKK